MSPYSRELERILAREKLLDGDQLQVIREGKALEGILLPRVSGVPEDMLTLKLKNGYNIGLRFRPGMQVRKLAASETPLSRIPRLEVKKSALPAISVIASGGTIGTHIDYRTGGVFMSRDAEELLSTTPELQESVSLRSLSTLFRTASEDFSVENWQALAKEAAKQLNEPGIRGAIITHGTDILHYTSAALAFMLQGLNKPLALVGAQRSPDRGSFDGSMNLLCAAHFCAHSEIAEVAVVMHGTSSDDHCLAHRGTKVRKMHTTRRDAFRSINAKPLAKIFPDGRIEYFKGEYNRRQDAEKGVRADAAFEKKTALLKIYPGANPELLDFLVEKNYRGVVLEGTALGHVPTGESGIDTGYFDKKLNWLPAIKKAVDSGVFVAVASQSLYGRTSPSIYRNLRLLADVGAVHCSDMLPETAYVKLGWVLAHSKSEAETRELMLRNLRGEMNPRITFSDFLS